MSKIQLNLFELVQIHELIPELYIPDILLVKKNVEIIFRLNNGDDVCIPTIHRPRMRLPSSSMLFVVSSVVEAEPVRRRMGGLFVLYS